MKNYGIEIKKKNNNFKEIKSSDSRRILWIRNCTSGQWLRASTFPLSSYQVLVCLDRLREADSPVCKVFKLVEIGPETPLKHTCLPSVENSLFELLPGQHCNSIPSEVRVCDGHIL